MITPPSPTASLSACLALAAGIVGVCAVRALPLYVNLTPSLPRGLWWGEEVPIAHLVEKGGAVRVALTPPPRAVQLGCVREDQALLKQVLAWPGESVCRDGLELWLSHAPGHTIPTAPHTRSGTLNAPSFTGCVEIGEDEVFLIGQHPSSCDSRHFGPVPTSRLLAEVTPLLVLDDLRSMRPDGGEVHP